VSKTLEEFQAQFITVANARLKRALAALATEPRTVNHELHGLAGEAGMLGFAAISSAASKGMELTSKWSSPPTPDQQLVCARLLRSLVAQVAALSTPAARQRSTGTAGRRALVVDDSAVTAEELVYALRDAGFEASASSTLEGTVESVREAPPDVVLIDANIPGVDVRALCDRLREHARSAKLLVVSAANADELRIIASHVGADGYVEKLHGSAAVVARAKAAIENAT
jgi:CheY-like chemotaxis protein